MIRTVGASEPRAELVSEPQAELASEPATPSESPSASRPLR